MMRTFHLLCQLDNSTQSTHVQITETLNGYKDHLYSPSGKISYMYLPYWIWFNLFPKAYNKSYIDRVIHWP